MKDSGKNRFQNEVQVEKYVHFPHHEKGEEKQKELNKNELVYKFEAINLIESENETKKKGFRGLKKIKQKKLIELCFISEDPIRQKPASEEGRSWDPVKNRRKNTLLGEIQSKITSCSEMMNENTIRVMKEMAKKMPFQFDFTAKARMKDEEGGEKEEREEKREEKIWKLLGMKSKSVLKCKRPKLAKSLQRETESSWLCCTAVSAQFRSHTMSFHDDSCKSVLDSGQSESSRGVAGNRDGELVDERKPTNCAEKKEEEDIKMKTQMKREIKSIREKASAKSEKCLRGNPKNGLQKKGLPSFVIGKESKNLAQERTKGCKIIHHLLPFGLNSTKDASLESESCFFGGKKRETSQSSGWDPFCLMMESFSSSSSTLDESKEKLAGKREKETKKSFSFLSPQKSSFQESPSKPASPPFTCQCLCQSILGDVKMCQSFYDRVAELSWLQAKTILDEKARLFNGISTRLMEGIKKSANGETKKMRNFKGVENFAAKMRKDRLESNQNQERKIQRNEPKMQTKNAPSNRKKDQVSV